MEENSTQQSNNRASGWLLVGLGMLFVLTQVFGFTMATLWPLFVVLPGIPFLYAAHQNKENSGLIFPGVIITGTGLLLLYQSLFDHWESWAYAWILYPVFVGIAMQYNGKAEGNDSEVRAGRGMVTYGLMALAGAGFLFEGLIFGGLMGGLMGWVLPLVLILGGVYLLRDDRKDDKPEKVVEVTPTKRKRLEQDEPPKRKYGEPSPDITPELRRRIDEALNEPE